MRRPIVLSLIFLGCGFLITEDLSAQAPVPKSSPGVKNQTSPNQQAQKKQAVPPKVQPSQYQQPKSAPPVPAASPAPRRIVQPAPARPQTPQGPVLSLALTHLLPSAFVIPGGTFILGTTTGAGFANIFDLTTNLYLDLEQVYNASFKLGLYKGRNFAVAPWVTYTSQSQQLAGTDTLGNPTVINSTSTSIDPGLTISYRILRRVTGHIGGDTVIRNPAIPKGTIPRTAYIQGNQVFKEFTFGLGDEVAMAIGGSYDLTYDIWGAGVSFHLSGLVVGAHYYFNVTQGAVMPLIGGGYAMNF